jgi:hypothetical protein
VRHRHELSEMARLTLVKTERKEVTSSPFFVTPSPSEGSLFSPPPGKRGEISRSARKDRVGVAHAKAWGLSGYAVPRDARDASLTLGTTGREDVIPMRQPRSLLVRLRPEPSFNDF